MTHHSKHPCNTAGLVLIGCLSVAFAAVAAQSGSPRSWWAPGQGTPLPDLATYENDRGQVGVLNTSGHARDEGASVLRADRHERARVRHVPSASRRACRCRVRSVRERWAATGGKDPLFAAVDGMNCPNLPPDDPRSHSLLLERGLIRVALPWPPRRPDGTPHRSGVHHRSGARSQSAATPIRSTGCRARTRRSPSSAARARSPTRSTRRIRTSASVRSSARTACRQRPIRDTGRPTSMNLMSDARAPTLAVQAADAREQHLQIAGRAHRRADRAHRRVRAPGLRRAGREHRRRQPRRARWPAGVRAAQSRGRRCRRARQQHDALRLSAGRQVDPAAAHGQRDGERAQRGARVDRARARRVHVPHVLDQGLDAPQHGRASAIRRSERAPPATACT